MCMCRNNEIWFESLNEKGSKTITRIREQNEFRVGHELETGYDKILAVLKSKGQREFSSKQNEFILASAAKYHHVPAGLMSGVADAAAVGASSGAVIGFTKCVSERRQATPLAPKKTEIERNRNCIQNLAS